MNTRNLTQVVNFPMEISNNKGIWTDDIFLDNTKHNCFSVILWKMDYQIMILRLSFWRRCTFHSKKNDSKNKSRLINDQMIANVLGRESSESAYNADNASSMLNKFHCIVLRNFEKSFPIMYENSKGNNNNWLTNGIRISLKRIKKYLHRVQEYWWSPSKRLL
jgi:hypothetical protein